MQYTLEEMLWLVLLYSFWGWILETAVGSIRRKRFVNRGFSNGPFCLVYGVAAVVLTLTMQELKNNLFFLFLGCMVICTVIEWFTGKILEHLNQQKWWDYSGKRFNFDGYICLQYSIVWGVLGAAAVQYVNRWFVTVFQWIPKLVQYIILAVLLSFMVLDNLISLVVVIYGKPPVVAANWKNRVTAVTRRFGNWIGNGVNRRIERAYPMLQEKHEQLRSKEIFAKGCGFYKLFWLFFIGCVLGDFIETIFCRLTAGVWMSRSSLVWGPFSLVWGFAIAIATALLYKDREKPDRHLFFAGVILGGAYEYICSVFTELVFGKVFWDYSEIPFNLGGRINLLYCFFWGIVAVIWIKVLYPLLSKWIEKIPVVFGHVLTWALVVFFVANIAMSMLALIRYDMRDKGETADSAWEIYMDEHYDDARMEKIYPNAIEK